MALLTPELTASSQSAIELPGFASAPVRPTAGLYLRTLRPLKTRQLLALVKTRIGRRRALPVAACAAPCLRALIWQPAFPEWHPAHALRMLDTRQFTFQNSSASIPRAASWESMSQDRLWLYHLNYFDFLNLDLHAASHRARLSTALEIACDWISSNPTGRETGWEPYPLSLRIVNWLKFLIRNRSACEGTARCGAATRMLASLRVQTLALERRLEVDLRANHLLKNAKALIFSGMLLECVENASWRGKGEALLRRELREQVLTDGGHFERSPMYHAQVLDDLLDLAELSGSCDEAGALRAMLAAPIASMAAFLRGVVHPDGEIPLFNDSTCGLAPAACDVLERAMRMNPHSGRRAGELGFFPETGYAVLRSDADAAGDCLIFDCGPLGPAYQPGHGHCDALSYELSLAGQRVVTDTGVSTYARCAVRSYERSTAAHNTIRIDGEEQAEVWSSFRTGRRPRVGRAEAGCVDGCRFARAEHDGYRRLGVVHQRTIFQIPGGTWVIADALRGRGQHHVELFIHFHPDVHVESSEGAPKSKVFAIRFANSDYRLVMPGQGEVELTQSWYAPEMGIRQPRSALHWRAAIALPAVLVCAFAPAGQFPANLQARTDCSAIRANQYTLPLS